MADLAVSVIYPQLLGGAAMATLIVFAGLPGVGKSSIARELARKTGAFWLRIDSIEQAIKVSGVMSFVNDAGYHVAQDVAADNLRLGHSVIADAVNGSVLAREGWRCAGDRCGARIIEVETICSDSEEHRRRVETRLPNVRGLILPKWQAVTTLEYEPWDRDHLTIDTAGRSVEDCASLVCEAMTEGA
jgi:predicted kinase